MIPQSYIPDYQPSAAPTETWLLSADGTCLSGRVAGLEAVRQAVYLALGTERFQYVIYPWNYGTELWNLFGQPMSYVKPELERRVRDALGQDDRVTGIDSFSLETVKDPSSRNVWVCRFTVRTVYGDFEVRKEIGYV